MEEGEDKARAGQRVRWQHPVGQQLADRLAVGRQGRTMPTAQSLPLAMWPDQPEAAACQPGLQSACCGPIETNWPAVGRQELIGLLWAD